MSIIPSRIETPATSVAPLPWEDWGQHPGVSGAPNRPAGDWRPDAGDGLDCPVVRLSGASHLQSSIATPSSALSTLRVSQARRYPGMIGATWRRCSYERECGRSPTRVNTWASGEEEPIPVCPGSWGERHRTSGSSRSNRQTRRSCRAILPDTIAKTGSGKASSPRSLAIANRGYVLQAGRVVLEDSCQGLLSHPMMRQSYLEV